MRSPLLSIVIANYNYGRFLEEAIQSVLSQSYDDYELIIVDGGSTDNSVEIIKKYADRIAWWCSEQDKGQSDAFNKGFAHARGRFLTWLNADDVMFPGALKAVARQIKNHPKREWFVGSSAYVDKELRITKWFCCHRFSDIRARYGFLTCGGPSSFFTKRLLIRVGGFDVALHFLMDIDLWYRCYYVGKQRYVRVIHPVFAYRIHETSKMSGADVVQDANALRNRKRAQSEFEVLRARYKIPNSCVRRIVTVFSLSIVDKMVSLLMTGIEKGKVVTCGK